MLYHYTTIEAFKSILRDVAARGQMRFWATRYDCFVDHEEFKLGVETIRRLLPSVEKSLQPDRRIAQLIDWNMIKDNPNMPYPYIISFTSRFNNDYMWDHYANGVNGVVLAIDDHVQIQVPDTPLIRLARCVYADGGSDDKIVNMLREEYSKMEYEILRGPMGEWAFKILVGEPQIFVKLIAISMIAYTAPRIKKAKEFQMEEETRVIIPLPIPKYNDRILGLESSIAQVGLNPIEVKNLVANEQSRQRDNGTIVFYRDVHFPIQILKGVYVRESEVKKTVEEFLRSRGVEIPVSLLED